MRYSVLLLSICITVSSVSAQPLSNEQSKRIDSVFAEFSRPGSPGCALGLYQRGKMLYTKGYGLANIENNVPITPGTAFDIGSTSKQFTAASLVLLQQQGKVSLQDDVSTFFPELPDYGKRITVRNLLNHTSGLRDYVGLLIMQGHDIDDVTTADQALRLVMEQRNLDFPTGEKMLYSNTGYFLSSQIVEQVSGQSQRDFAAQNIFAPLGMVHTSYVDDHTLLVTNRAVGYSPGEDGTFRRDVSYWEQNGDGGVFTTVEDLLLWDENFYNPRVGGPMLASALLEPGMLDNGETLDYALGLMFDSSEGTPTVLHGGAWGGYRAELVRVPSEHTSVAVLCNCANADPTLMAYQILHILLPERFPQSFQEEEADTDHDELAAVPFDPVLFEQYEGDYELEVQPGFILTVERDGNLYTTRATGQEPVEILPLSDTTFALVGVEATLTFHREHDGTVNGITLHQGGEYYAARVEPTVLSEDQLREYVGVYYSPELGIRYMLNIADGTLTLHHPAFDAADMMPAGADLFNGSQWYASTVEFLRNDDGSVEAMSISAGRVRGLVFVREE